MKNDVYGRLEFKLNFNGRKHSEMKSTRKQKSTYQYNVGIKHIFRWGYFLVKVYFNWKKMEKAYVLRNYLK